VLSLRVASSSQGGTFNVDFGGVNKSGTMTIPNTGGWQNWQTITATVQLSAGQQVMQIDFDTNGGNGLVGNLNWLQLTASTTLLVVSAGSSFSANAGATDTFAGTVSGGTAPYTYSWSFGDGGTSTGSATPSHVYANPGTYTATLTGTDSVGDVGTSSVVVTVNDVAPTVVLNDPPTGTVGTAVSFAASAADISPADQAAGFSYAWNFGDGGTATGADPTHTFSAAGSFTVTVTATDEYGKSGTASGTIIIGGSSTPYGGTPWAVPGLIQSENFDNGGQGVAYYTPYPGTGGDPYRGTAIGIQPTSDAGGGYNVGWTYATEWLNYTVNVASAGMYILNLRVASSGQGGTLNVDFGGVNATGVLTIPNTGGWQSWQTITATVQLSAGQQVMQVDFDTNGASGLVGNLNWIALIGVQGVTTNLEVGTSLAAASLGVPTAMSPVFAGTAAANSPTDDIGALDFTMTNSVAIDVSPRTKTTESTVRTPPSQQQRPSPISLS
jgi:PKD repeat protein